MKITRNHYYDISMDQQHIQGGDYTSSRHTFTIITHIVPFLSGFSTMHLAQTCAPLRSGLHHFVARVGTIRRKHKRSLMFAIKKNNRALCEVAYSWDLFHLRDRGATGWTITCDFEKYLHQAVHYNNLEIIELIYGWYCHLRDEWTEEHGLSFLDGTLYEAFLNGNQDLVDLLLQWERHELQFYSTCWTALVDALRQAARYNRRDLCEIIYKQSRERSEPVPLYFMFSNAAINGHRELCLLAREWALAQYGGVDRLNYDEALWTSVKHGHIDICHLVHDLAVTDHIPLNYDYLLSNAVRRGDRATCEIARIWDREQTAALHGTNPHPLNFRSMIREAARIGNRELCELARKWMLSEHPQEGNEPADTDADLNADDMLLEAAKMGHLEICSLAHDWNRRRWNLKGNGWIAQQYVNILYDAITQNRGEVCSLVHEWVLSEHIEMNWNSLFHCAAANNKPDLCRLIRPWGPVKIRVLFYHGAKSGDRALCELAHSWGERDYNRLLRIATKHGRREICELAREWSHAEGTTAPCALIPQGSNVPPGRAESARLNYNAMYRRALRYGHHALADLAREWRNESAEASKTKDKA